MIGKAKPPIGTAPYYIVARNRISSLTQAIDRYALSDVGDMKEIKAWAKEIFAQCEMIEELSEGENKLSELDAFGRGCADLYKFQRDNEIRTVKKCKTVTRQYESPWHKVADGDLPQGPYSKKRKFYCKEKGYGYRILLYDDKGFYYYSFDLNIGIENEQIVAWMELPEYEEEKNG